MKFRGTAIVAFIFVLTIAFSGIRRRRLQILLNGKWLQEKLAAAVPM
jgi:hypothetical protein